MPTFRNCFYSAVFVLFCFTASTSTAAETAAPAAAAPTNKGVGPVKELKLEPASLELATKGKAVFVAKCAACHKVTERYVGPHLGKVFERRTPEWIANMILNSAEMIKVDPDAMELFGEYLVPMPFQNVDLEEVKLIIQYFRHVSEKGDIAEAAKPEEKKTEKKSKSKKPKK